MDINNNKMDCLDSELKYTVKENNENKNNDTILTTTNVS